MVGRIKKTFSSSVGIVERMSGLYLQSYAKSGAWMLTSHFIGIFLALLTSYCFAHYLAPEQYGTYKYILSISGILGAFTLTGMNTAVTRSIAAGNEGIYGPSVKYQLKWNARIFIASIIPIIFFAVSGNAIVAVALAFVSLGTIFITAFNTYTAFLNAKKEFRLLTKYTVIASLVHALSVILAILIFKSALWIIIFSFAAQAINAYIFHKKVAELFPKGSSNGNTSETIKFGRTLSFNNIFKIISDQSDKLAAFTLLGPVYLAVYAFAQGLPDQIRGVFKIVPAITLPHLSERKSHNIPKTFWKYLLGLFLAVLGAVIVYNIFANLIFRVLFEPYMSSVPYSRILSVAMIPIVLTVPLTTFLNARGNTKAVTVLNTVTGIVEIVTLFSGAFFFGLWGIVCGKLISSSINFIIAVVIVRSQKLSTDKEAAVEEDGIYSPNIE